MEGSAHKAVVLVGFGSPDPNDPRPFLRELFSDPVALPIMRFPIFAGAAARALAFVSAGSTRRRYRRIAGSPGSLPIVVDLARRLEDFLVGQGRTGIRVVSAMRYGEPSLAHVLSELTRQGVRDVIAIPLFPQRALATTGSIEAQVRRCCRTSFLSLDVRVMGSWCESTDFVMAWVDAIRESLRAFPIAVRDRVHLLFTAHAILLKQERDIRETYPVEVAKSARLIGDASGGLLPMSVAFQSAASWGRWSAPTVENQLKIIGLSGARDCLIVPVGFAYENIETWCDLDMEILPCASRFGLDRLKRVPIPTASARMLGALASLVR